MNRLRLMVMVEYFANSPTCAFGDFACALGGANADVMAAALEVINADPAVKSIFVNIFGGITRVDEVAKGIIEAMGRVKLSSPVVMRLDGTNAVEGRALLADHLSDTLIAEPTMLEAARRAVSLASA